MAIDNNAAGRGMQGIAVGRKNWLFARPEAGGSAAAAAYTLIETAKLNRVDPQAWLMDVLNRISAYEINRVDERPSWHYHQVSWTLLILRSATRLRTLTFKMGYWIKRIVLKSGEVVTERELGKDQNRFDGPVPVIGDLVEVECRGRRFTAKVVWGNWPGRVPPDDAIIPLRVYELGFDEATAPLRFPRRQSGVK